ncbi:MAG: stage II sporulation protein E [Bacilli bacterium]
MNSKNRRRRRLARPERPLIRLVSAAGEPVSATQFDGGERKHVIHSSPGGNGRERDAAARLRFMLIVCAVGFLLGRAVILDVLTPFALAAYAVSLHMRRGASVWLAAGLLLGSATAMASGANPVLLIAMLISYRVLMEVLNRFDSVDIHITPFLVLAIDTGFRLGFAWPTTGFTWYVLGMACIDGLLSFLLTLMFLQLPPLFTMSRARQNWRTDEVFALIILLASLLTGLQGLVIRGVSLETASAGYLVAAFAAVGGAGIGGSVGLITGVILALGALPMAPFIGVLGFAGVLGGMLREGKRFLSGLAFLIGAVVLTLYTLPVPAAVDTIVAFAVAVLLLYVTPPQALLAIARFTPGTARHAMNQQEHARRIKELLTTRIEEVASVFAQLASSFSTAAEPAQIQGNGSKETIEMTVSELCAQCRRYERCWSTDPVTTHRAMTETIAQLDGREDYGIEDVPRSMYSRCVKLDQLLPTLKRSHAAVLRQRTMMRQLRESRNLVAAQLAGVGAIMRDLAQDIRYENGANHKQETQIMAVLDRLGLEVQGVDIISLEEGKVEIEILQLNPSGHDECAKLVAPLLSEVLGETITVKKTEHSVDQSYQIVTLASARAFQVASGYAAAAKDGTLQSGDFFSVMDVGNGRHALALSDGMGNGERANQESSAAVAIVQQLLKAGFDESVAVKTVNSALVLRSTEEMYATLDLAIIDLYSARTEFLKVGSVPSYIKQGKRVTALCAESLPIGIISDIEVQTQQAKLSEGDMIVFMSDGVLDAVSHLQDPDDWVRRQLERYDSDDPQVVADLLLEASARAAGGLIKDDMTVLCARIETFKPEWAAIRLPDLPSLRRSGVKRKRAKGEQSERLVHV